MADEVTSRRRQFLQSAGVGGTALLAGCSERLGLQNASDGDGAGGGDGERKVGIIAAVDQQALQAAQAEVQQQVQSGNLSQQEAQQEFQTQRQEIVAQGVQSLVDALGSDLSVEKRYEQYGGVVVSGPAGALLDALSLEQSRALIPAAEFENAGSSGSANSSS